MIRKQEIDQAFVSKLLKCEQKPEQIDLYS